MSRDECIASVVPALIAPLVIAFIANYGQPKVKAVAPENDAAKESVILGARQTDEMASKVQSELPAVEAIKSTADQPR